MASSRVEPNMYTHELLIQHYVHKKSVEAAVRALVELATDAPPTASTSKATYSERNLDFSKVTQAVFDSVLRLVCDVGETKLATGFVKAYEQTALQPVSYQVLYDMVEAGVAHDDVSLFEVVCKPIRTYFLSSAQLHVESYRALRRTRSKSKRRSCSLSPRSFQQACLGRRLRECVSTASPSSTGRLRRRARVAHRTPCQRKYRSRAVR